jgi:hypothetical protein
MNAPPYVRLTPETIDAIAEALAEKLRPGAPPSRLVCAKELGDALGVSRTFVYAHADALGARRLGGGKRQTLRFDLSEARTAYGNLANARPRELPKKTAPRRRRKPEPDASLLPIRGRASGSG